MIIKHNTPIALDVENAKSSFETVRRRQWAFHDRPTYRLILGTLEMLILKTLALTQMHATISRCGSSRSARVPFA
jgi:hypothetical protein